jgi:citrate synthase
MRSLSPSPHPSTRFESSKLRKMGVPLPQSMNNQSLTVVDNRTGKSYTIPISNNSIPATAFKKIAAPFEQGERLENETDVGLRVFDPG